MKKSLVILVYLIVSTATLLAQAPPPPPVSASNGGTNGFIGDENNAPIEGGMAIALAMVAGYGAWKLLKARQKSRLPGSYDHLPPG